MLLCYKYIFIYCIFIYSTYIHKGSASPFSCSVKMTRGGEKRKKNKQTKKKNICFPLRFLNSESRQWMGVRDADALE